MALDLGLHDLEIGNRGMQLGVPVDQPLVLVDQPLLVQRHEDLDYGAAQPLVHGKAFTAPVAGRAETAELAGDRTAGLFLPFPDFFEELLAPQVAPLNTLGLQPAFDHHLGGDTGMVGARLPQHVQPVHAFVTDQDILQGVIEGMAHMQVAGDIRRRNDNTIGIRASLVAGGEIAVLFPLRVMFGLDLRRPPILVQHRRRRPLSD